MTDAAHRSGVERNPGMVELRVAAKIENISVLRTLVGALGLFADLDIDSVADLRLAVDEACTRLIRRSAAGSSLVVLMEPGEGVVVVDISVDLSGDAARDILGADVVSPGSFSWHVLSTLTDDVRTSLDGERAAITVTARRAD